MSESMRAVAELERRRCEALAARDPDALRILFAEDYLHCHGNGMTQTREEMIRHMLANPRTIEPRDPDIRVYGDAAVIAGRMVSRVERAGEETVWMNAFATQVACKFGDAWRFVSFQATVIRD